MFLNLAQNCPPVYYAFFYTALKTGMRRGELLALEWTDIDFKNSKIWVNKQIYRGVTQTTKTGKERYVDMPKNIKAKQYYLSTYFIRMVNHFIHGIWKKRILNHYLNAATKY